MVGPWVVPLAVTTPSEPVPSKSNRIQSRMRRTVVAGTGRVDEGDVRIPEPDHPRSGTLTAQAVGEVAGWGFVIGRSVQDALQSGE